MISYVIPSGSLDYDFLVSKIQAFFLGILARRQFLASTSLFLTSHDKFNSPADIFPSSAPTLVSVPHRSLPLKPAPIFCNFLRKIDCWIDEILGLDYDVLMD